MDLQARLQAEVEAHNALLEQEQAAEAQVALIRQQRLEALGRVKATKDLWDEQLREASLDAGEASANGRAEDAVVPLPEE